MAKITIQLTGVSFGSSVGIALSACGSRLRNVGPRKLSTSASFTNSFVATILFAGVEMIEETIRERVRAAVEESEVMAVVAAVRAGKRVSVGDILEHHVNALPAAVSSPTRHKRPLPYLFTVETWHLCAAERFGLRK